ncbi:MAG: hypothetical protein JWL77_5072 [Chthonomonadaceae bacterium]|nr:hypothetical protein [Chthonomonadaceae bacterium]
MRLFQDLIISGHPDDLEKFRTELLHSSNGWETFERNDEWTQEAPSSAQVRPFIAINVPKLSRLRSATLFLLLKDEGQSAFVGNIVPDSDSLSPEEYNAILKSFFEECIQPHKDHLHLQCLFSSEFVFIEDTLSPENLALLRNFEIMANKSTGASHPNDYSRWINFIVASVRDKERLDTELLRIWLMDQGFPPYIASDLVQQYKFGFDLIEKMATEVPPKTKQEAIHADR